MIKPSIISEPDIVSHKPELQEIPVPVVMVMGLGDNCQKFELQLGLREAFVKSRYKVSQFGTKGYSELWGFEPLPETPDISMQKKIHIYNDLFYQTVQRESPDVLIIGVPGGIMPIASYANERFGETAMVISHAAKPDIALLSCYFVLPTQEYFDMLRQFARYRLGINEIDFHISNTNLIPDNDNRALSFLTLNSEFVLEGMAKKTPDILPELFHVLDSESGEAKYLNIIEKLQGNIQILV